MNTPAIEIERGEIKCDAPGCDYVTVVDVSEAALREFVDSKCPKCGAVLFTDCDFQMFKVALATVAMINELGPIQKSGDQIAKAPIVIGGPGVIRIGDIVDVVFVKGELKP